MIGWRETALAEMTVHPRRWATPGAMAQELDPTTKQSPALELLDRELVDLVDGDAAEKLMFFMPPQEGKSQRVSRRFPTWLLAHDPTLRIAIVSYELETAVRWGREIKRDAEMFPDLGITLRADSKAAGRWETTEGGGVYCVGIGGALTGRPVDVLIIDDPVKDRAAAESRLKRDTAWDFWENVGKLRLSARGRVALIMTAWHHDDLGGRLKAREPEDWRVITVPAIAEAPDDPLGREIGEELVSVQGRKPGYFRKLAAQLSSYVWSALFQQRPTVAEGNLFKRDDWRFWDPIDGTMVRLDEAHASLADCTKFVTIDLATSTKTSADFTVAAVWAITPSGDLLLLDRARSHVEESGHFDLVTPLRQRWLGPYDVVYVESRMFGTTFVYAAGRAGLPIAELVADVDKVTRAIAAAAMVRQHRVWLPAEAAWLDEWLDELAEFPNTAHDDQTDVMAYAARVALAHWTPRLTAADLPRHRSNDLDLMTIPM